MTIIPLDNFFSELHEAYNNLDTYQQEEFGVLDLPNIQDFLNRPFIKNESQLIVEEINLFIRSIYSQKTKLNSDNYISYLARKNHKLAENAVIEKDIINFIRNQDTLYFSNISKIKTSQVELDLKKIISKNPNIELNETHPNIYWGADGSKQLTIDIHGIYKNKIKFAIEYDGSFWHKDLVNFERDARKSKILLRHGYKVLRVREAPLKFLPLDHKNFYQFHFLYDIDHIQQNFAILLPQIFTMLDL